jgi:hypothetical protein
VVVAEWLFLEFDLVEKKAGAANGRKSGLDSMLSMGEGRVKESIVKGMEICC